MNKNTKAGMVATITGSNQNFIGGLPQGFDVSDFAIVAAEIQSEVLNLINLKPRKIRRVKRCEMCKNPRPAEMLAEYGKVCRNCVTLTRTKTPREKRRFIATALNNYSKSLKLAVAL